MHSLQTVLGALEQDQLLVQSMEEPPRYLPSRDPSAILVLQVLASVRRAGEGQFLSPSGVAVAAPVDVVLGRMELALDSSVSELTIRDLAVIDAAEPAKREPILPQDGLRDIDP